MQVYTSLSTLLIHVFHFYGTLWDKKSPAETIWSQSKWAHSHLLNKQIIYLFSIINSHNLQQYRKELCYIEAKKVLLISLHLMSYIADFNLRIQWQCWNFLLDIDHIVKIHILTIWERRSVDLPVTAFLSYCYKTLKQDRCFMTFHPGGQVEGHTLP